MTAEIRKSLTRSLMAISAILVMGSVGYLLVEPGWTILEAFYMTLITITTIGYGEIRPLSGAGRIFTSVLIVAGIGTAATALTQISSLMVESRIGSLLGRKKMDDRIKRMSRHYIICGFGDIGASIAAELDRARVPFLVVDADAGERARAEALGFPAIGGEATKDSVLVAAGVKRAAGIAICSGDLTLNLVVSMAGRELNPSLHIIARGDDSALEERLVRAGADSVAYPLKLGGQRIARQIIEQTGGKPADDGGADDSSVLGYRVKLYRHFGSDLGANATSVGEILERTGASQALSLRRGNGAEIPMPPPATIVGKGDALALVVKEGRAPREDAGAPLSWTEEMSVGISDIDEEHRMLLGLIARIGEATDRKSPRAEIAHIFDRLIEYTERHFEHEEALFRKHGYPGIDEHIAEHRALTEQVLELNRDRGSVLPENISGFLVDWLKVHIMGSDKKYVDFFQERGLR